MLSIVVIGLCNRYFNVLDAIYLLINNTYEFINLEDNTIYY